VRITTAELNRALLARQGLLERLDTDIVTAVERIGAIQSQHWPAVAISLAGRIEDFSLERLHAAFDCRELVTGTLIRGTLHATSAARHGAYAMVTQASGATDWRRKTKQPCTAGDEVRALLARELAGKPRPRTDIQPLIEDWFAAHPDAASPEELAFQRSYSWRPLLAWSGLIRVAAPGGWAAAKGPELLESAPQPPRAAGAPGERAALDRTLRWYLAAFGPAGADDIAQWFGTTAEPIQAGLRRISADLAVFENEYGRRLYDLTEAPRPPGDRPAAVRLLPPFDSTLLAYLPKRRERLLPEGAWDRIYRRGNLRVDPTFLVDGMVAGTWTVKATARKAALTLCPFGALPAEARAEAAAEAARLLALLYPGTAGSVDFAP
jgi:Winged helix DNA-binding domain